MKESPKQSNSQEGRKKRVLVVEDDEQNVRAAKIFFQSGNIENVEVEFARDFKEATNKLDSEEYDVVISDFLFPEKVGSKEKELGIRLTYELVRLFQEKLKSQGEIKGELITEGEFRQLVEAAEEVTQIFDKKKEDPRVKMITDRQSGGAGRYIRALLEYGMEDRDDFFEIPHTKRKVYEEVVGRIFQQFGIGCEWAVIEAAVSLASPSGDLQPLGIEIAKIAERKNIPYLLLSGRAHSGYGSGMQEMMMVITGEIGEKTAIVSARGEFEDDPMKETVKFVVGDKKYPEVWKKATQFLIFDSTEKKERDQ